MFDNPLVQISAFAALVFIIVSSQAAYKLTNGVARTVGLPPLKGFAGPTKFGYVVHALVFFGIMFMYLKSFDVGATGLTSFATF